MFRLQTSPNAEVLIQIILYVLIFLGSDLSLPWGSNLRTITPTGNVQQGHNFPSTSHQQGSEPVLPPRNKEPSSIPSALLPKGSCVTSVISGQPHNSLQLGSPDCYTIGLITALPIERAAVKAMLDEEHLQPELFERSNADTTVYSWGRIGKHNVVIASLHKGDIGKVSAALIATGLVASIPSIRVGLLVGIGGGVPRPGLDPDIRLGDVVVSAPAGTSGGVIEYDLGKEHTRGFERMGFLNSSPTVAKQAVAELEAEYELGRQNTTEIFNEALERHPVMAHTYKFPGLEMDVLFPATYDHVGAPDCVECNQEMRISRPTRGSTTPQIHYGVVATGSKVMKDARERDRIVAELQKEGIKAFVFEMEAAGLMNNFPCLVVRGISDYADSHKSDRWQRYAAMTAAAYAKELLRIMPPREIEFTPRAIEAIQELKSSQSYLLIFLHFRDDLFANDIIYELLDVGEMRKDVRQVKECIITQALNEWLHPPDPSENYNRAREARHEGTGSWLLHESRFLSWEAGDSQHLWIHGIMGCGKTVLAAMLIEHLEEDCLYFFFDHTTEIKQDFSNLLRSLVYQLYIKDESLRDSMHRWFSSHEEGSRQPRTTSLLEAFDFAVRKLGHVTIVLDALDECETLPELLHWMEYLHHNGTSVRFIFTSSRRPDIELAITGWIPRTSIIEIKRCDVSKDISAYVSDHLRSDAAFKRWRDFPQVQENIVAALMGSSDGMFRLAVLQLHELSPCLTIKALRQQLTELPRTLSDAYSNILLRVLDGDQYGALQILQLLAFSSGPLNIDAVVDILAFDPNSLEYDQDRYMPNPEDIVSLCQGLIQLGKSSGELPDCHPTREFTFVSLSHVSVKEFLISKDTDGKLGGLFSAKYAHKQLAKVCLAYLRLAHARFPKEAEQCQLLHEPVLAELPFLDYAAHSVLRHIILAGAQNEFQDQLADVWTKDINVFGLMGYSNHERWETLESVMDLTFPFENVNATEEIQICTLDSESSKALGMKSFIYSMWTLSPLHIEVLLGSVAGVKALIDGGADLETTCGGFGTPLYTAVSLKSRQEIAELLIDAGADINTTGLCNDSLLQRAYSVDNRDAVELLSQKGARMG